MIQLKMKTILALVCLLLATGMAAFAIPDSETDDVSPPLEFDLKAQNSGVTTIHQIATRDIGFHAIFTVDPLPDESCDLTDRAIIVSSLDDGGAMHATALAALVHGKRVDIRVEGCTVVRPELALTAPRAIRVLILQ